MPENLVSVCVVTFNQNTFISECLDSILNQKTNFPFEIILGEDDSSDGTRSVCQGYAEKYPEKIRLFLRSRRDMIQINGNPTGRFNFIENLKICKGKYIAFCEGDDYWTDPYKLQKQVDYLETHPECALCFTRAEVLRPDGSLHLHKLPIPPHNGTYEYAQLLQYHNFITTASVVFRRPEPFEFPEWFKQVPFGDLGIYKIVVQDQKIGLIEEVMSVYRIHDQGIYSKLSERKKAINYLLFYAAIFSTLNPIEKDIVIQKQKKVIDFLAEDRYPRFKWLQRISALGLQRKYPLQ